MNLYDITYRREKKPTIQSPLLGIPAVTLPHREENHAHFSLGLVLVALVSSVQGEDENNDHCKHLSM